MSDDAEQQTEEIEVLKSIYEGDDNFKQLDPKTYQYKYIDGEKSFILEISWGPTYPTDKPKFNLEIFYNQHLLPSVKEKILSIVDEEATQWLGCAMTYTLFECLKERVAEVLADQTEEAVVARVEKIAITDADQGEKKVSEKKEQLTKAQKRRAWDRAEMGRGGDKPRGWDWVDIVKHLSQEWFTPGEVAVHNTPDDCWVSLNGRVLDLTDWVTEQRKLCKCVDKRCSCGTRNWFCDDSCVETCGCFKKGYFFCDKKRLVSSVLAFAGKDISHWFDGDEWRRYTHPLTCVETEYYRFGADSRRPVVPSPRWRPLAPWWREDRYLMGKLTARARPLRITNSLTGSTVTLEVCSEETVYQILVRYLRHNSHAGSYSWRYLGRRVCFNKTLEQNGIPDERRLFSEVGLPDNFYIPAILLYYNDDLTEDLPRDCCCQNEECLKGIPEKCKRETA